VKKTENKKRMPFIVFMIIMAVFMSTAFIVGIEFHKPYFAIGILIMGFGALFKLLAWEEGWTFAETVKIFVKSFKR